MWVGVDVWQGVQIHMLEPWKRNIGQLLKEKGYGISPSLSFPGPGAATLDLGDEVPLVRHGKVQGGVWKGGGTWGGGAEDARKIRKVKYALRLKKRRGLCGAYTKGPL